LSSPSPGGSSSPVRGDAAPGRVARVLLPLPIEKAFDFLVPEALAPQVEVGRRVRVRFRGKPAWGIVDALSEESAHKGPLEEVLGVSSGPAFSAETLARARGVALHHLSPAGVFVNRLLPSRVGREEGGRYALAADLGEVVGAVDRLSRRAPRQAALLRAFLAAPGPSAAGELRHALGPIADPLRRLVERGLVRRVEEGPARREKGRPDWVEEILPRLPVAGGALLFARERWPAYAALTERTLACGRSALLLAPEVLLARSLRDDLEGRIGRRVALYRSGLPEGERGRVWEGVRAGTVRAVVGTRSALFLPFPDLGLLVVDEEQDRAYKQEEMLPPYHAREVALERVGETLVILGSGTPSFEAFHAARQGRLLLLRPEEPFFGPSVRIVDLRREEGVLSQALVEGIGCALAAGERVLLGTSRRGFFRSAVCRACGELVPCPRCGVGLVYEGKTAQLVCRLCGTSEERLACPRCGSRALRFAGVGGERVEEAVTALFPQARIARIDAEDLRTSAEERRVDEAIGSQAEILIASPMIAKGPPLPGFTLAGAIGVDALLSRPDFRAAEWAYQYVRGLAGRLEGGEVLVQTRYPEHPALLATTRRDYERLFDEEGAVRREFHYPPFYRLALLSIGQKPLPEGAAASLGTIGRGHGVEVLGPMARPGRGGAYLLKGSDAGHVRAAAKAAREAFPDLQVDLDPVWI